MPTITLNPGDTVKLRAPKFTADARIIRVTPGSGETPPELPVIPTGSFTAAGSSGLESVANPTSIVVALSSAYTSIVTVAYSVTGGSATRNTDYTLADGVLTFAIGETSKTIPLVVTGDIGVELDETVIITLSSPVNATLGSVTSHIYTIINDDVPQPSQTLDLGVNLEALMNWSRTFMLVNIAKHWDVFNGVTTGEFYARVITANDGGPGTTAPDVSGAYLFECIGNTNVEATGATVSAKTYSSVTNKTTATLTVATDSVSVDLHLTPVSGSTSDWKLHRPGYPLDTTKTFTDEFKRAIAPFRVLRCMDLMRTNRGLGADEVAARLARTGADGWLSWADRPELTDADWGNYDDFGVPVELMIQLANETGKDLWINISDLASADYISNLATTIYATLNANCKVYLEYSNEVWNGIFAQYGTNITRTNAYVSAGTLPALDGQNTDYKARQFTLLQLANISTAFRNVFGSDMMTRIRPVFCDQSTSPALVIGALNWLYRKMPQPVSHYIWGIASAPYYGPLDRDGTAEALIAGDNSALANLNRRVLWTNNSQGEPESKIAQYYGVAQAYGVQFAWYECGWDAGQGSTNLANKITASYDARMEGITVGHLAQAYSQGCQLACYFDLASKFDTSGQWGATDDVKSETSTGRLAKMKGLLTVANGDPRTLELAVLDHDASYYGRRTDGTLQAGTGLTGQYFRGNAYNTLIQTRIDRCLNFTWTNYGSGNPFPLVEVWDNATKSFSIKWRGSFLPRFTGSHKFTLETTHDSVSFLLNSQNMISNDTISLTAGTAVPLAIDYVPSSAGYSTNGKVRLWVEIGGGRKTLVQQACLRPT